MLKMMPPFTAAVIVIFVMYAFYDVDASCACNFVHPQRAICEAKWAFLGKVSKVIDVTSSTGEVLEQIHTVYVYKVIKGKSKKLRDSQETTVVTPGENDNCKINLQLGLKAIFAGGYDKDSRKFMDQCSWYVDYTEVPVCQRKSLFKKFYRRSCKCQIRQCSGEDCKKMNPMECLLEDNSDKKCFNNHGYCHHYRKCGVCSWKRCESFYDCQDSMSLNEV